MLNRLRRSFRVALAFNVVIFVIFIVASVLIIEIVNGHMRKAALEEAEAKARIILSMNLSIHEYFASELKPEVFSITKGSLPDGYFGPSWMSSTYAIREIMATFTREKPFSSFYYKDAAINARTPFNEADTFERDFINKLNSDTPIENDSGVRTINGEPYFVVLQKGETMQEGCLMCHSTPENAPSGLVEFYGDQRSFGRTSGMVISALSLRIPLKDSFARARELSGRLKKLLILVLALVLAVQAYITSRLRISNALLKESVHEKDMLIREVHHRVKNNLNVVESLLSLQLRDIDDQRYKEYFQEAQGRVKSMSLIHKMLHDGKDATTINTKKYIDEFLNLIRHSYLAASNNVALKPHIHDTDVDVDTMIPLALIINELVSNAYKHAFREKGTGTITVGLKRLGDSSMELEVKDDGSGLPDGFDIESTDSLGMKIVKSLTAQLDGSLEISSNNGTSVRLTFTEKSLS